MTMPDADTIDTFGGAKNDDLPVEDPTTDRSAEGMNAALEDVAQLTQTGCRAWARIVLDSTTPALANVNGSGAGWGNGTPPTPAKTGTGTFTVTWPATVTDGLGVVHPLDLRRARVSIEGSTFGFANAEMTTANEATIHTANAAGSANDLAGVTVHLEVF